MPNHKQLGRDRPDTDLIEHFELRDTAIHEDYTEHVEYSGNTEVKKIWHFEGGIGGGNSTNVWLEHERVSNELRAIKSIRKDPRRFYDDEIAALAKFSGYPKYFAKFYGWYSKGDCIHLALEYFQFRDLKRWMSGVFPERQAASIIWQIASGLALLHSKNFLHRDLKPQNIFVASLAPNWIVKIGDFGCMKRLQSDNSFRGTVVGTQAYQAPEFYHYVDSPDVLDGHTKAVDLWSLGCIAYELLTKEKPFQGELGPLKRYCEQTKPFPEQPLVDNRVSRQGIELTRILLSIIPQDRGSADSALESDWLKPCSARLLLSDVYQTVSNEPAFRPASEASIEIDVQQQVSVNIRNMPISDSRPDPVSQAANMTNQEETRSGRIIIPSRSTSPESPQLSLMLSQTHPLNSREDEDLNPQTAGSDRLPSGAPIELDGTSRESQKYLKRWEPGVTPIFHAAFNGDIHLVNELMEVGFNMKERTSAGRYPIHAAVANGQIDMIEHLRRLGQDLGAKSNSGYTLLHLAAAMGFIDIVRYLKDNGQDIKVKDEYGWTLMHAAAGDGEIEMVDYLKTLGLHVSTKDSDGRSPLHYAAKYGRIEMVEHLDRLGGEIRARDHQGYTLMHMAAAKGRIEMVDHLKKIGQDIKVVTNDGITPKELARKEGKTKMYEHLKRLEAGDPRRKSGLRHVFRRRILVVN